jgi:hypothetical protein
MNKARFRRTTYSASGFVVAGRARLLPQRVRERAHVEGIEPGVLDERHAGLPIPFAIGRNGEGDATLHRPRPLGAAGRAGGDREGAITQAARSGSGDSSGAGGGRYGIPAGVPFFAKESEPIEFHALTTGRPSCSARPFRDLPEIIAFPSGTEARGGRQSATASAAAPCRHRPVPAIYGPSGDVKWDEADPNLLPGGGETRGLD